MTRHALVTVTLALLVGIGWSDGAAAQGAPLDDRPLRFWSFKDNRASLGQQRVAHGAQLGGRLSQTFDFGETPFDIEPVDGIARGEIFSSANGKTFSIFAQSPAGNPQQPGSRIGGETILDHYKPFQKQEGDATLDITISEAILEAIDHNGDVLLPSECPPPNERCTMINGTVEFEARAYALSAGGDFFQTHGAAMFSGWQGHFDFDAATFGNSRTPLWDENAFDFDEDENGDGTRGLALLRRPLRLHVPLRRIPVGELLAVHVRMTAWAINPRGREASVNAYIRDPQRVAPALLETSGLRPVRRSPFPEPPITPLTPARCPSGSARGELQLSEPAYVADELGSGVARVLVTRRGPARRAASVRLITADGTAEAGEDYRRRRTLVKFRRHDRSPRLVEIPVLHDTEAEPEETVHLRLAGPRCARLGAQTEAELTIVDDDREVESESFTIGGTVSGLEGAGLVLSNLGEQAAIGAAGPFQFPIAKADGLVYDVQVANQPANPDQVCSVSNGAGTITGADVTNVQVDCVTPPPAGLDTTFGGDGKVSTPGGQAEAVAVQPDGAIVTAGHNAGDFVLMRHLANGDLDPTFGGDGIVTTDFGNTDEAFDVAVQPDGNIVAVGAAGADFAVARYLPGGDLDPGFGGGDGKVTTDFGAGSDTAEGVILQPDGRIVAGGHAQMPLALGLGFDNDFAVARYDADGTLDAGFSGDGKVTSDLDIADRDTDLGNAIALQPDGGIVLAGERRLGGEFALVRYEADGDVDTSFRGGIVIDHFAGSINGVTLRPDGRILAGGDSFNASPDSNFAVARYESDGDLDPGFGLVTTDVSGRQFGHDFGEDLALQGDGKIVVVGRNTSDTDTDLAVVRYLEGGAVDTGFDGDGIVTVDFYGAGELGQDVAIQPDGRIVAVGHTENGFTDEFALVRINP